MTHPLLRASPRLKNLGAVSAQWMESVGVRTRADLIRLGAVAAFLRVRDAGFKASTNLLWALAGAERGLRWNAISVEDRERLLRELDAAQAARAPAAASATPAAGPLLPADKPAKKAPAKPKARPAKVPSRTRAASKKIPPRGKRKPR